MANARITKLTDALGALSRKVSQHFPSKVEPLVRPPIPENPAWSDVSPLTGHPLSNEIDVPGRVAWIEQVIERNGLSHDSKSRVFTEMEHRIKIRENESRLFLGVVGEFSSGKTTLINALIRERLLRTDILQGTTAAATLIYHGSKLAVDIRYRKKNFVHQSAKTLVSTAKGVAGLFRKPVPEPSREELLALIHQATSDEEFAKDISQVNVELPAKTLESGLVIVDTPGTNAINERHAQVTSLAIRDLCDAVVVTVPAEAAGAESLINFLTEHASDIVHRCVFLVTKLDLIRRRQERERVLSSLTARLSQAFNLTKPHVLAAAPQFMIESMRDHSPQGSSAPEGAEGFTNDEIQEWVAHFVEIEKQLHALLLEKRLQSQADDIAKMMSELLQTLREMLQTLLDQYQARHDSLEKLVIPNIHEFIDLRADDHVKKAEAAIQKALRGSVDRFEGIAAEILDDLRSAIAGASNRSELKSVVESKIPSILSRGQSQLRSHVKQILKLVKKKGRKQLKLFHEDFQLHYRSLATLGGTLSFNERGLRDASDRFSSTTKGASAEIASSLQELDQNRSANAFGSGAAGALVGTMILPGIGTVVGGALGALFSGLFGPSLDDLKENCWEELRPVVVENISELATFIDSAVEDVTEQTLEALHESIQEYAPRYEALVEQMKQRDLEEKAQLAKTQESINADLSQLEMHRKSLNATRERIRNI